MTSKPVAALQGLTVLDVAGAVGNYCGKLFADLGARVILVEPPAGAPTRRMEPRIAGRTDAEAALVFQYENTNKHGITLDLETPEGQVALRRLASQCDLVIECESPGVMTRRGLDHASLARINPALVMTSITPFGQSGPCADWQATDMTAMAMGGMLYLAGYPDAPPMVACCQQAIGAANLFAAVASLAAVLDAQASGVGQHVDVSMQECVVMGMENAVQFFDLEGSIRRRNASTQRLAGTGVFECADGYIYLMAGGIGSNRFWAVTTDWLLSQNVEGAQQFRQACWSDQAFLASEEAKQIFGQVFAPFARGHTKAQLHAMAREWRIPLAPISDARDIVACQQRAHRGYFTEVSDARGTPLRMPGAPYRLSATPWRLDRRAPLLGEHNDAILDQISIATEHAARPPQAPDSARRLLAGVRVIDFSWIGAGSYTTKILADLGADVIKIESSQRLDTLRMTKPFKDGKPGVNRSGYFADRNSSKRSVALNLKDARSLALVKRLIAKADLVANNFAPGVMDKLGLGYDVLREINPRLVFVSMSMQGADGPLKSDMGYGLTIAALSGLQHMTGLPDREPAGTGTNYPDHIPNPGHAAFAILAALRHQRRTGEGQSIDLAQMEPTLSMTGPSLMNFLVNGVVDGRHGNEQPRHAPSGVYPCQGADRWIAIEVCDGAQWGALARLLGLTVPVAWSTAEGRLADRDALDAQVARLTRSWDSHDLARAAQSAGIPAGPVLDARDILRDPQLAHRGHWITLNHPEMGPSTYNAAPYRFSAAESDPTSPAPLLGQHTVEICHDLLGLSDSEIAQLQQEGALS